ncbi:uncharacterized protein K460DRAFT_298660 [Cucurbitaria berberidis CBS 394.84]|uniref:DUF7730 domain-containing protein n=1 Tax=Cucurbitaria berberidis CBS 394.84 TaxID=1168544 RepID=A0A9P4GS47_9PLEO|nr:uncharacterized protein K460DRAFT_298660 [Cucurbitaria berberidis CBS 394.84]KAF1851533.1 hypothetical protein K460DRAFT_298660 [Cucurbitaria berberidis CBS 394.84]
MQIPKTMSSLADPAAPSFLTTLPPEIRNGIYEILFKREEPVLLHNAEAYHVIEPPREHYPLDTLFQDAMDEYHETFETEIGGDVDFKHNFHEGLSMLRSCRQVYHEAAGIFYGENTFIFSRVLNRHDCADHETHDVFDYHPLSYSTRWLSSIGSQIIFLRKAIIDVDGICPANCYARLRDLDFFPLMRFLWSYPQKAHVITFAHTGRRLEMHTEANTRNLDLKIEVPDVDIAGFFNNVLSTLTIGDPLKMRRYAYFDRLVEGVYLSHGNMDCHVHYKGPTGGALLKQGFEIMDEGKVINVLPWAPTSHLLDLPYAIKDRIFAYALHSPEEVVLDLDARKGHGLYMEVFHVNTAIRWYRSLACCFSRMNTMTIKMTSTEIVTSFNDFAGLRELIYKNCSAYTPNPFHNILFQRSSNSKAMTLLLKLDVSSPTILSEARIETSMMCLLGNLRPRTNTTIRIVLTCPRGKSTWTEEMEVPYDRLQRELFLLLSDVIMMRGTSTAPAFLANEDPDLPKLWITGRGIIVNATYEATKTRDALIIENKHSQLSENEVHQKGYEMAAKVAKHYDHYLVHTAGYVRDHQEYHSLFSAWGALRGLYRDNWWSHLNGL